MSHFSRRLVVATTVAVLVLTGAGPSAAVVSQSSADAICHFEDAAFILNPPLPVGETATFDFSTVEPAAIWCSGTINGHTIDETQAGSYEEQGRIVDGTCAAGSGTGSALGRIPTVDGGLQEVTVDYDITYVSPAGGETGEGSGDKNSAGIVATFQFFPEDGGCVSAPLERFRVDQQQTLT